jgi:GWxTD domain-containing protein
VSLELRNPVGAVVWRGAAPLTPHTASFASGIASVPLAHADIGVNTVIASRTGSPDTTKTTVFLGFGPDLPVLSFDEMLSYLRFFAAPDELRALRTASPAERGERWRAFLRKTDPNPSTPQNEALDDYFERIRDANADFRNDIRGGWLSDRGMVYVSLGSPSSVYDDYGYMYMTGDYSQPAGARAHLLVWEYNQLPIPARIIFYDPNDIGQWRLTRSSVSLFQSLLGRQLNR